MRESVIKVDPQILGGTPCFAGTRVPIRTILHYLEADASLGEFYEDFPTVTPEKVERLIEEVASDRELLCRRLAEHWAEPDTGTPWETLRERLLSKGGNRPDQ